MRIKSQRRMVATGLTAGIAIAVMAFGGSAAYAYFTGSGAVTGSVSTKSIAITTDNFPNLGATYINTLTTLAPSGSFTVTNTGQTAGTVAVTISSSDALAAKLPVKVWPNTLAACTVTTVPPAAINGTWASVSVSSSTSLAPGSSMTFCTRTAVTDRTTIASSTGTLSATATLAATLTGSGWTASAATTTNVHKTVDVFPLDTSTVSPAGRWFKIKSTLNSGLCADVTASGGAGANLITYRCLTQDNQRFQLVPVSSSNPSLVTIAPGHASGMRVTANTNDEIKLAAAATGSASQQWYLQVVNATTWQLVSATTGKCWPLRGSEDTAVHKVVDCNTPAAKISLTAEATAMPTYSSAGSDAFTIGWPQSVWPNPTPYVVQRWTGTAWVTVSQVTWWENVTVQGRYAWLPESGQRADFPNGLIKLRVVIAENNQVVYDELYVQYDYNNQRFTKVSGFQ